MRKCVTCDRLGSTCGGPDFYMLSPSELTEWCKARKKYLGISNAKVAELSGVPRGTVDSFFASARPDFRYDTVRNILNALIGGPYDGDPCRMANDTASMARLKDENESLKGSKDQAQQKYDADTDFLKKQLEHEQIRVKGLRRAVIALAILFGLTLVLIIFGLIVDRLDESVGFFWLRSLIRGSNKII